MTRTGIRPEDEAHLRAAIQDAWRARDAGAWPFAARVVARDGTLLAKAGNAVIQTRDPTAHAEMQAIRLAAGSAGDTLVGSTLYASAEPCAMCAAALHWSGLGRVVFGVGEPMLRRLYGPSPVFRPLTLSCREVIASGGDAVAVVGPLLEDEAARPHASFWTAPDTTGASP